MTAYYNENDPFAAAWLNELIDEGLICPGYVDQRSIEEVQPEDLERFDQCHFFAGIGGWSYALRLAGWYDNEPIWTGSCACQPLSSAGQRKGHVDKRHLWPAFHRLIAKCEPSVIFGEQVASKDGREWLAGVRADLEALGYACGAADLCAAGKGAPHIRQRIYWVAQSEGEQFSREQKRRKHRRQICEAGQNQGAQAGRSVSASSPNRLGYADSAGHHERTSSRQQSICDKDRQSVEGLGNTESERSQEQRRIYRPRGERCSGLAGFAIETGVPQWNGPTIAVECSDGWRRVSAQPNAFPLAHGVSTRMGKLRGAGNAINPQIAQAFIEAWIDTQL